MINWFKRLLGGHRRAADIKVRNELKLFAIALYELRVLLSSELGSSNDAPQYLCLALHLAYALHNDALAVIDGNGYDLEAAIARVANIDRVIGGDDGDRISGEMRSGFQNSYMFRFTIRDLLWLMVVVGLAVGWCVDRYGLEITLAATRGELKRERGRPSVLHVGSESRPMQRGQKAIISVDENGGFGFQPVYDDKPAGEMK